MSYSYFHFFPFFFLGRRGDSQNIIGVGWGSKIIIIYCPTGHYIMTPGQNIIHVKIFSDTGISLIFVEELDEQLFFCE